ncbi:MAG: hypothetical protein ACR2M0_09630 [Chloroflexia bacterium]
MQVVDNSNMNPIRRVALTVLFAGLLGLTAACGGSATDTPVQPTNTTAAAPTTAMAADTPTTAMAANTPTTAMAADTPTTAMAGETPTAGMTGETPTGVMTGTTGGTLTGSGADILKTSTDAMKAVKTYHFTMDIGSTAAGQSSTTNAAGDFVQPDSMAMSMTVAATGLNSSIGFVKIGTDTWTNATGNWNKSTTPAGATSPSDLTNSFSGTAKDLGDTTLNGVDVHHVSLDQTTDAAGTAVKTTTEVWIDKATNYITQMKITADTNTAGQEATSDITMKLSKFNDDSIKVVDPTKK